MIKERTHTVFTPIHLHTHTHTHMRRVQTTHTHTHTHTHRVQTTLTTLVCARTIGKPMDEMTMPVVRKMHSSTQALLEESKLSASRRAIIVGTGDST